MVPNVSICLNRVMRRPSNLSITKAAPEPAPLEAAPGPPANYLDLYGLSKPPFGGEATGAGYILFGAHRRAYELLINHLVSGSGIVLLHGEPGIGKTETLRSIAAAAAETGVRTILVARPRDGRVSLGQFMAALEGRPVTEEEAPERAIADFMTPPRKVLLVDDIDLMPSDCIKALTTLAGRLPTATEGPAVILSSATDWTTDSSRPDLSPIAGVARNAIRMMRLGASEARQYIERSLWVAGGTTRRLISEDAIKLLVNRSDGVPGTINRMMEAAFMAGFARGDAVITAKTVAAAMGPAAVRTRPQSPPREPGGSSRVLQIAAAGLFVAGVSAFAYKAWIGPPNHSVAPKPSQTVTGQTVTGQTVTGPTVAGPTNGANPPRPQTTQPTPPARPAEQLSPELMAALMKRGNQSLDLGDVTAARLLFQRAAESGNPAAALALGKTFDPNYIAPGGSADPARAREWYRKAATLGDARAPDLLKKLGNP